MSHDEIRSQKALVLLKFKEAGDNLRLLEKEKTALVNGFKKVAGDIEIEDVSGHGEY